MCLKGKYKGLAYVVDVVNDVVYVFIGEVFTFKYFDLSLSPVR
jgi:hypothetical protein